MAMGSRGDQIVKKCELSTRTQHNTSSHLVMVSTLIFSTSFGTKWTHNAIGFLGDSLPSIEPHINLLKYNYSSSAPNEFCELHVFKLKSVQRFFTSSFKLPPNVVDLLFVMH
jgi:hypothetical protein